MRTITYEDFLLLSEEEYYNFTGILLYDSQTIMYLENGLTHRLDGPAIVIKDGGGSNWYYKNNHVNVSSQEEFETWLKVSAFE